MGPGGDIHRVGKKDGSSRWPGQHLRIRHHMSHFMCIIVRVRKLKPGDEK